MIKFFRRIRQTLLSENKFSKYLIYALGEIILVVIGILIALQINNRNEARKSTESENKALFDLKNEFVKSITELNHICGIRGENDQQFRDYLHFITDETIAIDKKSIVPMPGVYGAQWSGQSTVLSGIVNSGGLDNIKNDSLKKLLTEWPYHVSRWEKREALLLPVIAQWRDYMEDKIFRGIPEKSGETWNNMYPNYSEDKLQQQRKLFVNDLKFHNLTANIIGELWVQQYICGELNQTYEQIISVLESEIASRRLDN